MKECNMKIKCKRKIMQLDQSATQKESNTKKVQNEKSTT